MLTDTVTEMANFAMADLKQKLRTFFIEDIIQDDSYDLELDEPLISSGLVDSFSLVEVATFIEDEFDVEVDNSDLNAESFDTIEQIAAYIEARAG